MTEYWIWSNQHGAWWAPAKRGYVHQLQNAGRYSQQQAEAIIYDANSYQEDVDIPDEVAIPVINTYLPRRGQQILAGFEAVETLKEWTPMLREGD